MNHKSTENLLESSESIEVLHVPPLDLKQLNDDKVQKSENSDSERSSKKKPKRVQNNFLVEESVENDESDAARSAPAANRPPIPAARKLSLPPIASKRNGKDKKENSNQLTRKQQNVQSNDTIRMVNERPVAQPANKGKVHSNDSESDSDIRELKQSIGENANKMELKTFAPPTKNNLKAAFSVAEINEETTSFISYEEKHEKEDNSEHSASNHSSVNGKELPKHADVNEDNSKRGVKNDAFVQDPDDKVEAERPSAINTKSNAKRKEKKQKVVKKTKEKRKKRLSSTQHTGQAIERAGAKEESDDDITYDFKKLIGKRNIHELIECLDENEFIYNAQLIFIGVWIHETSALRFDRLIRQPRVRVSFYNVNVGELLSKSNPLRNAVLNYEPTNVTFIQPILSNRCTFKDSR